MVATSSYTTSYNMKYNSDILRQLHVELYDILREVVRVAELCDIPYFIQGGTAMGAHFFEEIVPWDDDIDLGMTRENYERFLREAPKHLHPDYILQEFTTEENTPFYFMKIRKRDTRFVESEWVGLDIEQGIYIDIFPYDLIPDNAAKEQRQRLRVKFWVNCFTAKSVWLWRWWGKANNGVVLPKGFLSCLAIRLTCLVMSKRRIYRRLHRELTRYNHTDATRYNIVRMPKDMIPRTAIDNPERRRFGDMMVWAPSSLEQYLRNHYGDISKWLPEEKQLNHAPEQLMFSERLTSAEAQRITIVIPLYNKEREVERCLRSVVEQSLAPHEVIIVDDGSTDSSAAIVERFIADHPEANMRLVRQDNSGVSAARNRAIGEATTEYVALLDADDYYLSGYIAEIARLMEYYPDVECYSTAFSIVNNKRLIAAPTPTTEGIINPAEEALQGRYPIIPSTATLRREAVLRAGGFPEGMRIGEDQWLWIRLIEQGSKFCFSTMPLVRYARTASNRSAKIYRPERCAESIAALYTKDGDPTLNEYIARVGIGKAITQSVHGGTEDAQRAIEAFAYSRLNSRQLRRLRVTNSLPRALRPLFDSLYRSMAWMLRRRGM